MKRLYAVFVLLSSFAAHAAPDLNYATRVVLVTDLKTTVVGTHLAFKRPGGCVFSGIATEAKVVDITHKTCRDLTTTVKMVVPLERQKVFIDDAAWPEFDWISESAGNYLLFPVESEAVTQKQS